MILISRAYHSDVYIERQVCVLFHIKQYAKYYKSLFDISWSKVSWRLLTQVHSISVTSNTIFIPIYEGNCVYSFLQSIMPHYTIPFNNQSVIATSSIQILANHYSNMILCNHCPSKNCTPDKPPCRTLGVKTPGVSTT